MRPSNDDGSLPGALAGVRVLEFAPPIRMDRTPTRATASSPVLDADTDAVLAGLGYSSGQIAALRASGIAGSEPS